MAASLRDRMDALPFMAHVAHNVAEDPTVGLICLTEFNRYDETPLRFRTKPDVSEARLESAARS
eukprot:1877072-Pyramimonas_sp.AAC.1